MDINRSNYEIWLIDLLDGNLSDEQAERVRLFLAHNPDLNEEFSDVSAFSLPNQPEAFHNKKILKKSPGEISQSQFEYLCVAFLENDITEESRRELIDITVDDEERKKTFDVIQKAKLVPPTVKYQFGSDLIKVSPSRKIVQLAIYSLSVAAIAAFIFLISNMFPGFISSKNNSLFQNTFITENYQKPVLKIAEGKVITISKKGAYSRTNKRDLVIPTKADQGYKILNQPDTSGANQQKILTEIPSPVSVRFSSDLGVKNSGSSFLVASNTRIGTIVKDDDMSNVERLFARLLREKVLGEKDSKATPLKGVEIAEAGITGLNRLLGWEMALNENNDENGELKSVSFSSKLLKFNAPVKKSPVQP
jgi:hypothetical protein